VKQKQRDADRPSPSSTDIKNVRTNTSVVPIRIRDVHILIRDMHILIRDVHMRIRGFHTRIRDVHMFIRDLTHTHS